MLRIAIAVASITLSSWFSPVDAKETLYPVCSDGNQHVYIKRDMEFAQNVVAKSKLLGSAVYETQLITPNQVLVARFDCRTEHSNISLDTKNYISVDPNSCAGVIHKTVCGF